MIMKPHTQKFLQRRKFAMVMPVLVLPFVTLIFWALDGGQGSFTKRASTAKTGLNLQLPAAHFGEEEWNKMALYDKARRDSLKSNEERQNDPYFNPASLEISQTHKQETKPDAVPQAHAYQSPKVNQKAVIDPNEEMVNRKLEQLYRELNKANDPMPEDKTGPVSKTETVSQTSTDVQKLEQMMEMMKSGDSEDPEMQNLGGMLDKILDVQHPDRVRDRIKDQSKLKKGKVFPVHPSLREQNISLMNPSGISQESIPDSTVLLSKVFPVRAQQNSFYGLEDEAAEQPETNAIEAVVHDTQEVVAGSTVKMRLLNDVFINGKLVPKDQFVYGTAAINGERLAIAINSIREDNSLFPVSLSVYDLDGIEGIYIPGAITRDAAKQSSDQAMQSLQFLTMDQSLKAQAMSAGVQAAKGLFSKKVKQIKVTIKAGYKILLMGAN